MYRNQSIALRVQKLSLKLQTLILSQMAAARSTDATLAPAEVSSLFSDLALPSPARIGNIIATLTREGLLTKVGGRGSYRVTPLGKEAIRQELSDLDIASLYAEASQTAAPMLGNALIPLVPVSLAPPELILPLQKFLEIHPFDRNVFGMTRFPDLKVTGGDPIANALKEAREVCAASGLELHLASDRAISDHLWTNVTAHMWGCRYGLAIFEDRVDRGLNHNLLIEVGGMMMSGRRCALLKDGSIARMPTDFVGLIYKSIDLDDAGSVRSAVTEWIIEDLLL